MFIDAAEYYTENTAVAAVQYRTVKENSAFRQTYSTKEKCREKVQRHVIRNEAVLQGVLSTDNSSWTILL